MRFTQTAILGKPTEEEVSQLSIELQYADNLEYSLEEIVKNIENGRAVVLENIDEGSRKQSDFISTPFIGLDLDDRDWTISETHDILKENKIDYYLIYKTASYMPNHQKHRVILKFDKELNLEETYRIQSYLNTLLPLDKATVGNVARIWYGTFWEIEDKPGKVINADELLGREIVEKIEVKVFENNGEKNTEYIISNVNYERYEELCDLHFENWDYDTVRRTVYSSAVIMKLVENDNTCIEIFLSKLEGQYVREYEKYFDYDIEHGQVFYVEALETIAGFAVIIPAEIEEIFDILKGVEQRELKDGEYITPDVIKSLEKGTNLLSAPAGKGKSTAIIKLAQKDKQQYRVLIVPTLAIVEQLKFKYGDDEDIEFLYSGDGSNVMKQNDNENYYMTICTYDAYYYNSWDDHVLHIDEAHEFISFHSISGKRNIINGILRSLPKNVLFTTASPLNLADTFDTKVFYKAKQNKFTTIVEADSVASGALEVISDTVGSKTLVYINSKSKLDVFKNKLIEMYPDLKVDIISSVNRGGAYEQLLNDQPLTYDIVLVTKILNIGFDINDVFDVVIYANAKVLPNDVLQFFNRERQKADFYCIIKSDTKHNGVNINTSYRWYKELLPSYVQDRDKMFLDDTYIGDTNDPHLITNYKHYKWLTLGVNPLIKLFEYFYDGFNYLDARSDSRLISFPNESSKDQFMILFFKKMESGYTRFEELMSDFLNGDKMEWTFVEGGNLKISPKTIKRLLIMFVTVRRNLLEYSKRPSILHITDSGIVVNYENPEYWWYLSDDYIIEKLLNEDYVKILKEVQTMENKVTLGFTEDDIDKICKRLNVRKLYVNNRKWTPKNFINNLERFRIYFKRNKMVVDEDDGGNPIKEYIWVNKTVLAVD